MINALPFTTETNPQSSIEAKSPKKSMGKDDFLKLLVAQMEAQDPMDPMKSADFSAQLAQFSALEQMFTVNKNLESLILNQASMNNNMAVNLIDKMVTAPGNNLSISNGQPGTISYELGGNAASVTVNIFDSLKNQVASIAIGSESAGIQKFVWSGKSFSGNTLPDGNYDFTISAMDESGLPIITRTSEKSKVTEVVFEDGRSYVITENNNKIDINNLTGVSSTL